MRAEEKAGRGRSYSESRRAQPGSQSLFPELFTTAGGHLELSHGEAPQGEDTNPSVLENHCRADGVCQSLLVTLFLSKEGCDSGPLKSYNEAKV